MSIAIVKSTKPQAATWLGKDGMHCTFHFDDNEFGKRIHVRWMDDFDTTEINAIEGDGCSDNFKSHAQTTVPGNLMPQPERMEKEVLEMAEAIFGNPAPAP